MTKNWRRNGTTVYLVESNGFRKGVEEFRCRYNIEISGDYGGDNQNTLEALAIRLVNLLNGESES